jgi:hypothetical protein
MEDQMNLKQFKSWKLLYEDEFQCFSKAILEIDEIPVFLITIFNPEEIAIATKHMLPDHLHNFLGLIEDDGRIHIALKTTTGKSLKKLMRTLDLSYEERVELAYSYLKKIELYDVFPDVIKIQLLDEEQLLISNEGVCFRELIDYTLQSDYTPLDVLRQLGEILDKILYDAKAYHNQFIDNLLRCKHPYTSIKDVKNSFKDIFIFEKPEALDKIDIEYNIILNDLDFGPPVQYIEMPKTTTPVSVKKQTIDIPHDDLQTELAALLRQEDPPSLITDEVSLNDVTEEIVIEAAPPIVQDSYEAPEIEPHSDLDTLFVSDQSIQHTNAFETLIKEEKLPESLPKSTKSRAFDDEDLLDEDMSDLFDMEELNHTKSGSFKPILLVAVLLVALVIIYFGAQFISSLSEPIKAQFEVEQLLDNRVAFMNTSEGKKKIDAYAWEIYYGDTLISTFEDENLFPLFDTSGTYTIVLKVMDKSETWLEPYTFVYEFKK